MAASLTKDEIPQILEIWVMPSRKYYFVALRTIKLHVSRPRLEPEASPLQFGSFTAHQSAVKILFNTNT
jgi:hypothetical protein